MADTRHRNENSGNTHYQVCFYSHHTVLYNFYIFKWPVSWNKFNLLLCNALRDKSHLYTPVRPLLPAKCTHKCLSVMNASVEMAAMELNSFRNLTVLKEKFFWSPNTMPGYEQSKAYTGALWRQQSFRSSSSAAVHMSICPKVVESRFPCRCMLNFPTPQGGRKAKNLSGNRHFQNPLNTVPHNSERAVSCAHAHRLPRPGVTQSKAASIR